jgi:hypothetical protein
MDFEIRAAGRRRARSASPPSCAKPWGEAFTAELEHGTRMNPKDTL